LQDEQLKICQKIHVFMDLCDAGQEAIRTLFLPRQMSSEVVINMANTRVESSSDFEIE
jgi:hypothetical protein